MRTIVYKDIKIPPKSYDELIKAYSDFITKQTGIVPVWYTHDYDFTDYPTVIDTDGDDIIRPDFLQQIADEVTTKYGDWGADHIVTLIHEDNWKSGATSTRRGISGTNYSYRFNNYHVQYVRWWKRKGKSEAQEMINRFGTLNHEQDHSYDALISRELGVDIRPILGVVNYDKNTTHGEPVAYHGYIKYQENAQKLRVMAPYLKKAYQSRKEKHLEPLKAVQRQIIAFLQGLLNRK